MSDEADLFLRIAAGDADAFGRWAASAEGSLRRSLRPFAAVLDTEAVLQEALLRVWQVAPRFTPDGAPNALLRFAMTVTRHAAISELRRSRPSRTNLDELERQLTERERVAPEEPDPLLRTAIVECREKLPKQPRLVLDQRVSATGAEDDSALAERVGMTLNTFLQNFTRARKLLAECLQKKGIRIEAVT